MPQRTKSDPTKGLIDVLIDQAGEALTVDNLTETKKHLQDALDLQNSYPKLPERIRELLKQHCDQYLATNPTAPWNKIMQSLALITELELHNDESQVWSRGVQFRYTAYLLSQNDIDSCFTQFREILDCCPDDQERDEIIQAEIVPQIRTHISRNVEEAPGWDSLTAIITRLEQLWPEAKGDHEWLETIRRILDAAETEHQTLKAATLWNKILFALLVIVMIAAALAVSLI